MTTKNIFLIVTIALAIIIVGLKVFFSDKKNLKLQLTDQKPIIENINLNVKEISTASINVDNQRMTTSKIAENYSFRDVATSLEVKSPTKENDINFYSLEEVSRHNSKEGCWSIINNEVYDLTNWIDRHPGGADNILLLCGKDGTDIFLRKHGNEKKPLSVLNQFKIGKLKE